jgi:hypothetical protein
MSKALNYIALGFFLSFAVLILLPKLNQKECITKSETYNKKKDNSNQQFLNLNVYQNVPPDNYNYLVNYPNGPWSWGEWSWGREKGKSQNYNNYAILDKLNDKEKQRGINN